MCRGRWGVGGNNKISRCGKFYIGTGSPSGATLTLLYTVLEDKLTCPNTFYCKKYSFFISIACSFQFHWLFHKIPLQLTFNQQKVVTGFVYSQS